MYIKMIILQRVPQGRKVPLYHTAFTGARLAFLEKQKEFLLSRETEPFSIWRKEELSRAAGRAHQSHQLDTCKKVWDFAPRILCEFFLRFHCSDSHFKTPWQSNMVKLLTRTAP